MYLPLVPSARWFPMYIEIRDNLKMSKFVFIIYCLYMAYSIKSTSFEQQNWREDRDARSFRGKLISVFQGILSRADEFNFVLFILKVCRQEFRIGFKNKSIIEIEGIFLE